MSKDGTWAKCDKDKADTFAAHLSQVFTPNLRLVNVEDEVTIHNLLKTQQPIRTLKPTNSREIKQTIKSIKTKKAPGYDLITSEILKELPEESLRYITHLFNA